MNNWITVLKKPFPPLAHISLPFPPNKKLPHGVIFSVGVDCSLVERREMNSHSFHTDKYFYLWATSFFTENACLIILFHFISIFISCGIINHTWRITNIYTLVTRILIVYTPFFSVIPNSIDHNEYNMLYILDVRTSAGAVSVTHGGKLLCYWKIFSGRAGPPIRFTPSCQPEVTAVWTYGSKNVILRK